MDKLYSLDLPTLINFLRSQTAVLYTSVDISGIQGPCQGYVFLKEGTIIGSVVRTQDEKLVYQGQEAFALLSTKTRWQLRIDPKADLILKSMEQQRVEEKDVQPPPIPPSERVPRPLISLDSHLLNGYTPKQRVILRTVFAMVNGERTVEQIKGQLNLSSDAIEDALAHLHALGIVM